MKDLTTGSQTSLWLPLFCHWSICPPPALVCKHSRSWNKTLFSTQRCWPWRWTILDDWGAFPPPVLNNPFIRSNDSPALLNPGCCWAQGREEHSQVSSAHLTHGRCSTNVSSFFPNSAWQLIELCLPLRSCPCCICIDFHHEGYLKRGRWQSSWPQINNQALVVLLICPPVQLPELFLPTFLAAPKPQAKNLCLCLSYSGTKFATEPRCSTSSLQ